MRNLHLSLSFVALLASCYATSIGCGSEETGDDDDGEDDGGGGRGGETGEGGQGGGSKPAGYWQEGCGDVISCSFFFNTLSNSPGDWGACFTNNCSAEIAACGTDGEACAAATRCGDDPLYADFKTGCFSDDPAVFNNWDCYFDRPECKTLRDQQPAARDLLTCISQCIGWSPQCSSFPPGCSSL